MRTVTLNGVHYILYTVMMKTITQKINENHSKNDLCRCRTSMCWCEWIQYLQRIKIDNTWKTLNQKNILENQIENKRKKMRKKNYIENGVLYPTHHTIPTTSNFYTKTRKTRVSHITIRFTSCIFFFKIHILRVFYITLQLLITLQSFTIFCVCVCVAKHFIFAW